MRYYMALVIKVTFSVLHLGAIANQRPILQTVLQLVLIWQSVIIN
jgi:hypothetical protein